MENPEEILHSLEEFSKMKPKDIPRELEEYLSFVAKTGNPIYQWPVIKSLFREKLISVITEFYESCPTMDIPPCPNVEMFNYDMMKNFILEKLDTFAAAPFTVQRICELLTSPRKEYNRIDKYMRALEKNILVVSTTEPGRRSTENGEGIMNGIESEHLPESSNSSHDINIEDMDESPSNWVRHDQVTPVLYKTVVSEDLSKNEVEPTVETSSTTLFESEQEKKAEIPSSSTIIEEPQPQETVITCTSTEETIETFVSVDPQEAAYQNLSEESNSNSSDSSSSASACESKEVVIEEKEATEEVPEIKVDTTVPAEQDEITNEVIVSESKSEVALPQTEETVFEPSSVQKPDIPESTIEEASSDNSSESQISTDITLVSENSSEAEEKPEEKEAEQSSSIDLPETKEVEKLEEVIVPVQEEIDSDNVVDSSTDVVKGEDDETLPEKREELDEQVKEAEVKVSDVPSSVVAEEASKTEDTPVPMEIDVRENTPEKKPETEEPSSSVEAFVKLMSAYYSRD